MKNLNKVAKKGLINKFIIVLTLWLLTMMGISIYVGYRVEVMAFNYIALSLALIIIAVNALFLSLRFHKALHISPKQKEKYNR